MAKVRQGIMFMMTRRLLSALFVAAVRHVILGSADLSRNGVGLVAGRGGVGLHPRAARVWRQPYGIPAQQLTSAARLECAL